MIRPRTGGALNDQHQVLYKHSSRVIPVRILQQKTRLYCSPWAPTLLSQLHPSNLGWGCTVELGDQHRDFNPFIDLSHGSTCAAFFWCIMLPSFWSRGKTTAFPWMPTSFIQQDQMAKLFLDSLISDWMDSWYSSLTPSGKPYQAKLLRLGKRLTLTFSLAGFCFSIHALCFQTCKNPPQVNPERTKKFSYFLLNAWTKPLPYFSPNVLHCG